MKVIKTVGFHDKESNSQNALFLVKRKTSDLSPTRFKSHKQLLFHKKHSLKSDFHSKSSTLRPSADSKREALLLALACSPYEAADWWRFSWRPVSGQTEAFNFNLSLLFVYLFILLLFF